MMTRLKVFVRYTRPSILSERSKSGCASHKSRLGGQAQLFGTNSFYARATVTCGAYSISLLTPP
jgi:hypothetical protein